MSDQKHITTKPDEGSNFAVTKRPASPMDEDERALKQRRRMQKRLSSLLGEITGESPDGSHDPQKLLKNTQLAERIARLEMNLAALDFEILTYEYEEEYLTGEESIKRMKDAERRFVSASFHFEEHSRLLRIENSVVPKLTGNDHGAAFSDVVHAMSKDQEGPDRKQKRAYMWLSKAEDYYGERNEFKGVKMSTWCPITGRWVAYARAAHIVPYCLDDGAIPEHLFGERAHEVDTPTNSLLMDHYLKRCFDEYQFVIVPVDPSESPITRWKVDIISSDIRTVPPIDGNELRFRNDNRPNANFLYFRFMLTLIRIRDKQRAGWENIWARYRTTKPFGTPGRYCRDGMLMAMATHSKLSAPEEIEAFLVELCGPETIPPVVSSEDVINGMRKEVEEIVKQIETVEETDEWNDIEDWYSGDDTDSDEESDEYSYEDSDEDSDEDDEDLEGSGDDDETLRNQG